MSTGVLLRKYDCEAGLNLWRLALRSWSINPDAHAAAVFTAAASLDEVETCGHCIRTCTLIWEEDPRDVDDGHDALSLATTGADFFDFAQAGTADFEALPYRYVVAVLRAWRVKGAHESMQQREVRDRVADEFERLVKPWVA